MRSILIPFAGFYYSLWDHEIDHEIEQYAEWLAENDERFAGHDTSDIIDALLRGYNSRATEEALAREYALSFGGWLARHLGLPGGPEHLAFDEMVSPKYYNFETDRVFLNVSEALLTRVRMSTRMSVMAEVIRERHSSRPGFISFYSNDISTWMRKPAAEWDHNELGTLLIAWMRSNDHDPQQVEDEIFDTMRSNGAFSNALDLDLDHAAAALADKAEAEA